jgi:hypothetical protein
MNPRDHKEIIAALAELADPERRWLAHSTPDEIEEISYLLDRAREQIAREMQGRSYGRSIERPYRPDRKESPCQP